MAVIGCEASTFFEITRRIYLLDCFPQELPTAEQGKFSE